MYDLGRKKLLRKCENKHIPHLVVDIKTVGERIICSDVQVRIIWVCMTFHFVLGIVVKSIRNVITCYLLGISALG